MRVEETKPHGQVVQLQQRVRVVQQKRREQVRVLGAVVELELAVQVQLQGVVAEQFPRQV